jgi:hypothetical protein
MIKVIDQPSVLDSLPRLEYHDISIEEARLIEGLDGTVYIFLDDYVSLVESGRESLIYSHYHVDPSKLGVIVDEVRLINNPHYLKSKKKYIKNTKVSIRPLNTKHQTRLIEDAISFYEQYQDFTLFDQFINEDHLDDLRNSVAQGITDGIKSEVYKQAHRVKGEVKADLSSTAKKGAALLGTLYLGKKIADHVADSDARKPRWQRSELIKKLRVLAGKKAEYESKYERAEREHWENKGIIGKILWKIKAAIRKLTDKLHSMINR